MNNASVFGLGAQRHAVSIAESYRRQASGGRTLLEQQAASVKKRKESDGGPMVLHKHQHKHDHADTHHHYPPGKEPDGDEMEVVVKPERTPAEGRRV